MAQKPALAREPVPDRIVALRPIRPFLTGAGIALIWGAVNAPVTESYAALGEFIARLAAGALIAGGVLAVCLELVVLAVRYLRPRLAR